MAPHDPVEDALNERKRKARLVEAGAAVGLPNKDALDITQRFLAGGRQLPGQAAPIAGQRAFGQQGARRGRQPIQGVPESPGDIGPGNVRQPLSERFFDLPTPMGFAQTPQGRAILQRILGGGVR